MLGRGDVSSYIIGVSTLMVTDSRPNHLQGLNGIMSIFS